MARNANLSSARKAKNDEFYTLLDDIEAEISSHEDYTPHFEGKTVLCNCDDPEMSSSFFTFFKGQFHRLKMKKLITTHYNKDGSPSHKWEWWGEMLNGDMVNLKKTQLSGNGDFASPECVELLKEADIVVTNPPFSLFRKFMAQLLEHKKKFVIIGNMNCITYKEIFPLLKEGKMRAGYGFNQTFEFIMPDDYVLTGKGFVDENGKKHGFVPAICWFTNLDLDKHHEPLILNRNYTGNESRYPTYDNYAAIECGKVKDIPKDYYGVIGVPITYMEAHCPEQFEIVGLDRYTVPKEFLVGGRVAIDGKPKYARILIKRKEVLAGGC